MAPYHIYWSDDSVPDLYSRISLCENIYTVNIEDTNFCGLSISDTIFPVTGNMQATLSSTPVTCNSPGTFTITIPNSTGFQFNMYTDHGTGNEAYSAGVGGNSYTTNIVIPGVYLLYYYDNATKCGGFQLDTITSTGLYIDTLQYSPPNVCTGDSDGVIQVGVLNGTAPYTYSWSNSATTSLITQVTPGFYSVSAGDNAGCTATQTIYIPNQGGDLFAYPYIQNAPTCSGPANGVVQMLNVYGIMPLTYQWSVQPSNHTSTLTGVAPGTYSCTITDSSGCVIIDSLITVTSAGSGNYVYVGNEVTPDCGAHNGSLTAIGGGGNPPYNYAWSNGQTTATITGLASGTYTVTLSDQGTNCSTQGYAYLNPGCYNTITGYIFNDQNSNCIFDGNDYGLPNIVAVATGNINNINNQFYALTDSTGYYSMQVDTGTYSVQAYTWYGSNSCGTLNACANASQPAVFGNTYNHTDTMYNFGVTNATGFDLTLHPGWTSANPGFEKDYWIFYYNQGLAQSNVAATVVFQFDSNLVYEYTDSVGPVYNAAQHTLSWPVTANYNFNYVGLVHFLVPATLSPQYVLQNSFYITPTSGDCDSTNNYLALSDTITGSMDPNSKTVSPAGRISESDSVLTYTINFQNDGTAPTNFVVVTDTLSKDLNPATVQNIASSQPYSKFSITGPGILTWVFNPIHLAPQTESETASKGFVTFSVKRKANLALGTSITNRASIVFDYNNAIVTNTIADTVSNLVSISDVVAATPVLVKAYPNPFNTITHIAVTGITGKFDFILYDVTGRQVKAIRSIQNNQFDLDRETLSSGVYFYQLSFNGSALANGKVVAQ